MLTNCLPSTGSTIWPMVVVAVLVSGGGLLLHRLATGRRGTLPILLLIVGAATGLAVMAPRVDAHATTCDPSSSPATISEDRVESIPIVPDAFVSGGVITPDQAIDVAIDGFEPSEEVDVYVASVPRWLGTAVVGADGVFRFSFRIPTDLEPGAYNLLLLGRRSGRAIRQPVTLIDTGGPTTSTSMPPRSTTTSTTTPVTPTTTVPSSTSTSSTSTTAPTGTVQTLEWGVDVDFSTSDSPMVLPAATTDGPWWISPVYDVVSAGTTNCALDPSSRELTFDAMGTCEVRVTFAGWFDQWAETSRVVTIEIGPAAVCDSSMTYQRGDTGPGGGKIFYVSPTCKGWGKYLEVAPGDWTGSNDSSYQARWCDTNRYVTGASSSALGRGIRNTWAMAAECSESPALLAQAYRGGGKVDWAVPSEQELIEMCKWAHRLPQDDANCGGFSFDIEDYGFADHYWSSTQNGVTSAIENWLPGGQDFRTVSKDTGYVKARPIRAFGLIDTVQASWSTPISRVNVRSNSYLLDFSESITGLTASDIDNSGTASGCVFTPESSSGTSVVVNVVCASDGTIVPVLAAGSVTGGSGLGPTRATPGPGIWIDTIAPSLELGTIPSTMVSGLAFALASDEVGAVHLVHDTVSVTTLDDIISAADGDVNSVLIGTANTEVVLNSAGLTAGTYHLYASDSGGNISAPSAAVSVRDPQSCTSDCLVGDVGPGGGTVVYDAGSVQSWGRYLEFAPSDWQGGDGVWPDLQWCDVSVDLAGATGSAIGDGRANSLAMLEGCSTGVAIDANAYRGGGQVDWHMASIDEWKMVCRWVKGRAFDATNCGGWDGGYVNGDGFTSHYWTSTQVDTATAMETYMPGGDDFRIVAKQGPGWGISARPIRAFGAGGVQASIVADQTRSSSQTLGFTVDFSESITGFAAADLTNIGSASGCAFTPASSSGTSIHVSVTCSVDGTVVVEMASGSVVGSAGVGPSVAVNSPMVPIDSIVPTVDVISISSTLVAGTPLEVSMSERGDIYIVDSTITIVDRSSITSAADSAWNTSYAPDTAALGLMTTGLANGTYDVYAIDQAGNISSAFSMEFTIRDAEACSTSCLIGDIGPGGGRVVYNAGSAQSWGRYIEVAPSDASPSGERPWCDASTTLLADASGSAIGTGLTNSQSIAAGCTTAAAIDAMAYRGGSLSDWFLPSADEMRAVCRWALGAFGTTGCSGSSGSYVNNLDFLSHYWTSTQIDATNAYETWMPGGNDYRMVSKAGPGWGIGVRPVRYF